MANERTPQYCLQCDDGTVLEHGARDVAGDIDGQPYRVEQVRGWHCPVCAEIEFDPGSGEGERVSQAIGAAAANANARLAQQMRATRKKLKLSQTKAKRLFRGSVSAFSAYENGHTQPHKSTVLLLRLLDKHPELLAEVR
jgi:HTH-type transcriptional regulator/antitoxin MqsA